MGFLSSVLPGLREIRPAVLSGYLWLLAGWLSFGAQLDAVLALRMLQREEWPIVDGVSDAAAAARAAEVLALQSDLALFLQRLGESAGPVGTAVAITALAWIVGVATYATRRIPQYVRLSPIWLSKALDRCLLRQFGIIRVLTIELGTAAMVRDHSSDESERVPADSDHGPPNLVVPINKHVTSRRMFQRESTLKKTLEDFEWDSLGLRAVLEEAMDARYSLSVAPFRINHGASPDERLTSVLFLFDGSDLSVWAVRRVDELSRRAADLDLRLRLAVPLAVCIWTAGARTSIAPVYWLVLGLTSPFLLFVDSPFDSFEEPLKAFESRVDELS